MTFSHWIHHLFDPHCQQCADEAEERRVCQSCETLKMQLSIANHEKQEMLNTILSFSQKPETPAPVAVDYEKIKPKMMAWNIRKQMLEAEDRKAAQILAGQKNKIKDDIGKLEKEVNLDAETIRRNVQEVIQSRENAEEKTGSIS